MVPYRTEIWNRFRVVPYGKKPVRYGMELYRTVREADNPGEKNQSPRFHEVSQSSGFPGLKPRPERLTDSHYLGESHICNFIVAIYIGRIAFVYFFRRSTVP